jgi:VanZ family protein
MCVTRTDSLASRIALWAAPFALMGLIFFLSAQPDLGTDLGTIDLVGRKFVHMAEYALLFFLWWRALRTVAPRGHAIVFALAIAVGYAVTDEFHQSFVNGRNGNPVDVAIDSVGASLAAFAVHRRGR